MIQKLNTWWLIGSLAFAPISLQAQTNKRLGVVDVETDGLLAPEKIQLLEMFRKRLAEQRILLVVRQEEINSYLVQKNPLREKIKAEILLQENRLSEAKQLLQEGWRYYRASQFGESINVLESAWKALDSAPLVVDLNTVLEILGLLVSCHFFEANEDQALSYMKTILDLSPAHFLDVKKFPPPVVDFFNEAKKEDRYIWKNVEIAGDLEGAMGKFLGRGIPIRSNTISLPSDHPDLGTKPIVLYKENVAPVVYQMDKLPSRIEFESLGDKRVSTKGLFMPMGEFVTPPLPLKSLLQKMNLSVALLAFATKDLNQNYVLKGQWLETRTSRTSPVVEKRGQSLEKTVDQTVEELLKYISPDGQVMSDVNLSSGNVGAPFAEIEASSSKAFYKTWWFWTLVGVGVAGVGTGSYFLFKPDDTLKFSVSEVN